MRYFNIRKINFVTEETINYGIHPEYDLPHILRGYKFNGLFYDRKNSNWFFVVDLFAEE